MRARVLVVAAGSILALAAAGAINLDISPSESNTPVVAACSVQGSGCDQPSLDGGGQFVISYEVFQSGCSTADLHVMRYTSRPSNVTTLVATWCG